MRSKYIKYVMNLKYKFLLIISSKESNFKEAFNYLFALKKTSIY
jgi:hypothetical protein